MILWTKYKNKKRYIFNSDDYARDRDIWVTKWLDKIFIILIKS